MIARSEFFEFFRGDDYIVFDIWWGFGNLGRLAGE